MQRQAAWYNVDLPEVTSQYIDLDGIHLFAYRL